MDLQFTRTSFPYLGKAVGEIQNLEQTQEIKLTDGMPDVGRVLGAWGQIILRSKEWRSDSILFSGGLMVWVLYMPEDGSGTKTIDSWIPFQMKWDLPDEVPEGKIRVSCLTRFVDARSVSPRKIMVRAGVAALGEAYVPTEGVVYEPDTVPDNVQLLKSRYPVQLPKEAGETEFTLDEEFGVSGSQPSSMVYYTVRPEVTDKKVLGNKIAFRGNGNLHVLYETEEGRLESQDFLLPFSQFAELDETYGSDAEVSVNLCTSNLELELDENGQFRLKCGFVPQYLVSDRQILDTVEDAYSPGRELTLHTEQMDLPSQLDARRETLYGEQNLNTEMDDIADISFLPDFARQQSDENGIYLEAPGSAQILYYSDQGGLHSTSTKWEGYASLKGEKDNQITVLPQNPQNLQISTNGDHSVLKADLPVEITATSGRGIPLISGLEMGETTEPDAYRPSLILRRAGGDRLWDIAKSSGSTMDAIRSANGLEGEPAPGQMLLIPVS